MLVELLTLNLYLLYVEKPPSPFLCDDYNFESGVSEDLRHQGLH